MKKSFLETWESNRTGVIISTMVVIFLLLVFLTPETPTNEVPETEEVVEAVVEDESNDEQPVEKAPEQEPEEKPVIEEKDPAPINFNGVGDTITQAFNLKEGYALVKATHTGFSNIVISAIPNDGFEDLLVNEIGNYSGTTLIEVTEPQGYLLEITADGNWTVEITQPTKAQKTAPTSLAGQGDTVIPIIFPEGNRRMTISHTGESNFVVSVNNPNGFLDFDSLVVNEIGNYSGSNLYQMDNEGLVYLEVNADGNWTIDIE